ncbi:MAG: hypothetical protein GF334_13535 [Candidatus Altiarchaeales archaeon]|nr:hypothetical protein [Candidatus Altiarchaeales archaeon]
MNSGMQRLSSPLLYTFIIFTILVLTQALSPSLASTTPGVEETFSTITLASTTSGTEEIISESELERVGVFTEKSGDTLVGSTGKYSVSLAPNGDGLSVEFTAHDTPLEIELKQLVGGGKSLEPSLIDSVYSGDTLEYKDVFGEGINLKYVLDDTQLKESIIFEDEQAAVDAGFGSGTMALEFYLKPSDRTVVSLDGETLWDKSQATTSEDIRFIRNKEPHKLYLINEFYTINAPFLNDSSGTIVGLTYTLEEHADNLFLRLNIPPIDEELDFPVVIDPTIEWNDNDGVHVNWENWENCSSDTDDCYRIYEYANDILFDVDEGCSSGVTSEHPVRKSLFEFDIDDLYDYGGSLYQAKLWTQGSCSCNSFMPSDASIKLYHIEEFSSSDDCSDHPDDQEISYIRTMMDDDTCYGSTKEYDTVTSLLEDRMGDTDDYFAFKLDIYPATEADEDPNCTYSFEMSESNLELEYYFECDDYTECPPTEYCKDDVPDICDLDLDYGDACEDIAVGDEDDYACPNNNCQEDDFDGSGAYCTYNSMCVHNGANYSSGLLHCATDGSYHKTCQGDTTWTTSTSCSYGCTEGVGCVTTTTTTTTTTTLAPDININPTSLTFERYVG